MEKENEILLGRQFSLDKIKDDNSAILFYTGFPCYEALISFFKYLEPKLGKMQYWKGEHLVRESQPYQEDENRNKPGPSRKLTFPKFEAVKRDFLFSNQRLFLFCP